MDLYDRALDLVPAQLHGRSGGVLFAGREAFTGTKPLYVLGLNPGGDPAQKEKSVGAHITRSRGAPERWSVFALGKAFAGKGRFHVRVRHLLEVVDPHCDPCLVPTSNVVFVRSKRESDLAKEKAELLRQCWPVHALVIEELAVRVVVCLGRTAGSWVRERLGASELVDQFEERNKRKWQSCVHRAPDGMRVVTVTHPSIADWTASSTDPSQLVARSLAAANAESRPGTPISRDS